MSGSGSSYLALLGSPVPLISKNKTKQNKPPPPPKNTPNNPQFFKEKKSFLGEGVEVGDEEVKLLHQSGLQKKHKKNKSQKRRKPIKIKREWPSVLQSSDSPASNVSRGASQPPPPPPPPPVASLPAHPFAYARTAAAAPKPKLLRRRRRRRSPKRRVS